MRKLSFSKNCKRALSALLVSLCLLLSSGRAVAQDAGRITLKMSGSLEQVLDAVERQSRYLFLNDQVDLSRTVSVDVKDQPITETLDQVLKGTGIKYKITETNIIISNKTLSEDRIKEITSSHKPQGKSKVVSGRILDQKGEPVIGGAVMIKGTSIGASADIEGNFSFTLPEGSESRILEVSSLGYTTLEMPLNGQRYFNFTLVEDSEVLEGTVVTALGIRRAQKALSYNVQEVKSDDILSNKDANFINSLSGKAAGLVINASSAGVGGATKAVMRGSKSITKSSNALYVIDGVPMSAINRDASTEFGSNGYTDPIADLNPEDIESMTVLTGAAAAALYGQDGANGAIVITTKKGAAGKTTLTISNNTEFSNVTFLPKFQDTYGTGDLLSSEGSSVYSWGRKLNEYTYMGYDPKSDYFKTGVTTTESISLSTGTDKNQTYLSVAAINANGTVPNNAYNRYNFAFRNTANFLDDKLTLDLSFQYVKQNDRNMINQGLYNNPLVGAYLFPRGDSWEDVSMYERWSSDRSIYTQYWPAGDGGIVMQNPYWINYRDLRTNKKDRYMAQASLSWKVLDWVTLTGRVRIDNTDTKYEERYYATTNNLLTGGSDKGYYALQTIKDKSTYADAMADIHKSFGEYWNLQANIGGIISDSRNDWSSISGGIGNGTIGVENIPNVFNVFAIGAASTSQGGYHDQTQSVFASVELGYRGAWYLTLTARNDWDSRLFGPGSTKSSFFYPSVGLSGVLSQALNLPKFVELLKVRGSYAQVGTSYQRWIANPLHSWDNSQQAWKTQTAYPVSDLKPEMTASWEAGIQTRIAGGFSFDLSWYLTNTKNQTFNPGISSGSGYSDIYIQSGNVRNTGIELQLGYNHSWGKFSWNSVYTFSTNKNKIISLAADVTNPVTGEKFSVAQLNMGGLGNARFILQEGGSLGDIYSRADLKRDNRGSIYVTETGAIATEAYSDFSKYIKLGSVLPKANMAWRNEFKFGNFSASAMVQARLGGIVFSRTQAMLDRFGVSEATAIARDNGGVVINGSDLIDASKWYTAIGGGDTVPQFYTYDATNVRLSEAAIGYTFPRKMLWNMFDLTLQVVGKNLLMIYCKAPFDPEATATTTNNYYQGIDYFMMPGVRTYGFNVRLNF